MSNIMTKSTIELDSTLAAIESALPIDPQPYTLDHRPAGLIMVDEVNGFCTVGHGALAPAVPNEQVTTMISESDRLAKSFIRHRCPVFAFLDTHDPGKPEPPYPPHCVIGTGEENLVRELSWLMQAPAATLVRKDCINGFIGAIDLDTGENKLLNWVNHNRLETLVVVGICTDICVMDLVLTLLSVRNHGMMPTLEDIVVYTDGCSTFDLSEEVAVTAGLPKTAIHPQYITHHMGLYLMASRGACIASEINW